MNQHLIIYADNANSDIMKWALFDPVSRKRLESDEAPLKNILEESLALTVDIYLIVSSFDATLHYVDIPARTEAQARAAVPYMIEDDLSASPENLHFAIGAEGENSRRPVVVIARDILNDWLSQFYALGIKPTAVYTDINCLSTDNTAIVYQTHHNGFVFSIPDKTAGCVEADMANLIMPHIFGQHDTSIAVYSDQQIEWLNFNNVKQYSRLSLSGFFTAFSEAILSGTSVNLLQGDFANRKSLREIWLIWQRPLVLTATLMLVFLGYFAIETWQLSRTIEQLDNDTKTAMEQAFPGVRTINQVRSRVRASQTNATDRFILLSEILFNSVQENENVSVISTRYDENRGELSVSLNTGSFNDVELVKKAVEQKGAGLTEGSSRQVDGRIIADVIVRERTS